MIFNLALSVVVAIGRAFLYLVSNRSDGFSVSASVLGRTDVLQSLCQMSFKVLVSAAPSLQWRLVEAIFDEKKNKSSS